MRTSPVFPFVFLAIVTINSPSAPGESPKAGDVWKARFEQPVIEYVDWSSERPERVVYRSNKSGTWQCSSWDRLTDRRTQLTDNTFGVTDGQLTRDGQRFYYFDQTANDGIGCVVSVPFEGGKKTVIAPTLKQAYDGGFAVGGDSKTVFIGQADRSGYRLYRTDALSKPVLLCQCENETRELVVSADGKYVALTTKQQKTSLHFVTRILNAQSGEMLETLGTGIDHSVIPVTFPLKPGDNRLLLKIDESGVFRPMICDLSKNSSKLLPLDRYPGDVAPVGWYPGGGKILLKHTLTGFDLLLRYELASGDATAVQHFPGHITRARVRDGGVIWFNRSAPRRHAAFYQMRGGRESVVLAPSEVRVPPKAWAFRSVTFESEPGVEIHGFLGHPPAEKRRGAVVYLHDGPRSQTYAAFDPILQTMVDNGLVVLAINYRGSEGYGCRFAECVLGQPGRAELIDAAAARQYLIDQKLAEPDRIILRGSGYGGYLTLLTLGKQPKLWAMGCAVSPVVDPAATYKNGIPSARQWCETMFGGTPDEMPELYAACSALTCADQVRAPVLVVYGQNDARHPTQSIKAYLDRLRSLSRKVEDFAHAGGQDTVIRTAQQIEIEQRFHAFVDKHLPAKSPTSQPTTQPSSDSGG